MEPIKALTAIDYSSLFIASFTVLVGLKVIVSIFEWMFDKLGLETKWMRKKREEHDLLIQTSRGLAELQKNYTEDMKRSDDNDSEIRQDIKNLTSMFIEKEIDDIGGGSISGAADTAGQTYGNRNPGSERPGELSGVCLRG